MNQTTIKRAKAFDIESNIKECDVSYRGGTLKVDVSEIFPNIENPIMGAYQNYLGGGIAGAIVGTAMFDPREELNARERKVYEVLNKRIKRFFYNVNAGGGDDYMVENVNSYKQNQNLPVSYPGL